jgi:hypothetical protein
MNLKRLLSSRALLFVSIFSILLTISACSGDNSGGGEKSEGEKMSYMKDVEGAKSGDVGALPEGHPTMNDTASFEQMPDQDHSQLKSTKEVKVSDEIKAMYKAVNLEITDRSSGKKEVVKVGIGKAKDLTDGFSLNVVVFLPDYSIYDDYIASKTNELSNPAVKVSLYKGKELISSGWIFEELIEYNSYNHMRFAVVLLPTK